MSGLIIATVIFVFIECQKYVPPLRRDDGTSLAELLDHSPQALESKNRLGMTLLQTAAFEGYCNSLRVLIDRGAIINSWWQGAKSPDEKYNPLHITAINGQVEAAKMLIAAGAHINALSLQGKTPLDVAIMNGHRELAQLFREHGGRCCTVTPPK